VGGQTVMVFDLNLDALDVRGARREATEAERLRPPTLRVVVNEASGAVTLTSRR
jgi:hypothetical protein